MARPRRKSGVKQSTDVRYSDRGFAFAELSSTGKVIGLVPSYLPSERPDLSDTPKGVLIHNKESNCLELSDPESNQWVSFCTSGIEVLGVPTDGTFGDGPVIINPTGSIADAIDSLNEYLNKVALIEFASHLGTTDGLTNGVFISPIFSIGRVSTPQTYGNPYYTNSWDNDSNKDLLNTGTVNLTLGSGEKITDLQEGTIKVKLYNGNNALVYTSSLILNGTLSNQSSSDGYVSVSSLQTKAIKIEGSLSINFPYSTFITDGGYIKLVITHEIGPDTYEHPVIEFFFDTASSPVIVSQSVTLDSAPEKYLSGVKFAAVSGSTRPMLRVQLSASGIWRNSYRADPILVDGSNLGIGSYVVNYNSSAVTKAGQSPPVAPFVFDQGFIYEESRQVTSNTLINPDSAGNYKQIRATLRDPFNSTVGSYFGPTPQALLNTYPVVSTDTLELFLDEDYRLEASSSGTGSMGAINGSGRGLDSWDSQLSLLTRPALQVINGALIYPQNNFSSTVPLTNPNYTTLGTGSSGALAYVRRFRDSTGLGRTNGILRIDGLSEADRLNKNILVEIRVVGNHLAGNGVQGLGNEGTGWLSLNDPFNIATFNGDTGDGCLVTTQGLLAPNFEFTLGSFSTSYASNQAIEVRITFPYPNAINKRLTRIQITDWT